MTGKPVSDLTGMLAGMEPRLHDEPYRFVEQNPAEDFIGLLGRMFAMIDEGDGLTLILRANETHDGPLFARITLQVHSDLEGVGLTAAVASAVAEESIACNVVAGYRHDHLFVPWPRRDEALAVLDKLSHDARR